MVLGTLLGSTTLLLVSGVNRQLGLSDQLFVLGDSMVLTVLGQVSADRGLCGGVGVGEVSTQAAVLLGGPAEGQRECREGTACVLAACKEACAGSL